MTTGEVFLTGSWSRWQCFGPWLEAMSSDRVMIDSCYGRSWHCCLLIHLLSLRTVSRILMSSWNLSSWKFVIWEIIHHVHCYMPLNSSYTHSKVYFNPSHILGDRVFLKMNGWMVDTFGFFSLLQLLSFFSGCGGYLHTSRGVITSPNYPQNYSPNLNCSWHVVVATGSIIAVHFEQPFQIKSEDTSCTLGDYIEVRLLAGSPNPQSY